jgi:hypothetical protein
MDPRQGGGAGLELSSCRDTKGAAQGNSLIVTALTCRLMKFVLAAIIFLILGDVILAHGANTAMAATAVMRFFHATGDAGHESIFSR